MKNVAAESFGYDFMCTSSNLSPSTLSTIRKRRAHEEKNELGSSVNEAADKTSASIAHGISALASALRQNSQNSSKSNDMEMRKPKRRKSLAESLVNLAKQIYEIKLLRCEQQDIFNILEAEKEYVKKLFSK